ncbi:MAG: T9SS C-terminal target domain-containing protein [Segatella oris]
MKLRLLVFFGLLTSFFINTQAQAISNEVVFVDTKGNVLAPNATLNLNKVEESFIPGWKQITEKLFISNTSAKTVKVKLSCTITTLKEGQLQVCALENCTIGDAVNTYDVATKELPATAQKEEIHADYSFPDKGKCIATLQLFIEEKGENGATTEKAGPKVTLNFDPKSTGIVSSSLQDSYTYDIFNAKGILLYKQLTSLSKLPKGVYIVNRKGVKGSVSTQKYIVP